MQKESKSDRVRFEIGICGRCVKDGGSGPVSTTLAGPTFGLKHSFCQKITLLFKTLNFHCYFR